MALIKQYQAVHEETVITYCFTHCLC